MTIVERIHRGEAAIARAKAQGRDVAEWERHLKKLKAELKGCRCPAGVHEQARLFGGGTDMVCEGCGSATHIDNPLVALWSPVDAVELAKQWPELAGWMARKPKTTRYMTPEERAALDEEISQAVGWARSELARLKGDTR